MKRSAYLKTLLSIAGITGIAVGIGQLFFPVAFEASSGVHLANEPAMLSEFRGSGGTLLAAGVVMLTGAFNNLRMRSAVQLAILFFLSYGFSRVYALLVDGMPGQVLLSVLVAEIVIGLLLVQALYSHRKRSPETAH